MEHVLNDTMIQLFRRKMEEEEKAEATIRKYIHDIECFFRYTETGGRVNKTVTVGYKAYLMEHYAPSSVNSMLAAVNVFLKEMGWYECTVKPLKMQKEAFRRGEKNLSKEEYYRLLDAAMKRGNTRLSLIMQTLCSTGIRISELKDITAEAVEKGYARVASKGKRRTVLLPKNLCTNLKRYIRKSQIKRGSVFITRNGNPVDRSNVCHDMKALCAQAGVLREKIFPHNLRHLFALTYYKMKKDLSHLADMLGHANINTTRIYTLVSCEEQMKQIELLGLVI